MDYEWQNQEGHLQASSYGNWVLVYHLRLGSHCSATIGDNFNRLKAASLLAKKVDREAGITNDVAFIAKWVDKSDFIEGRKILYPQGLPEYLAKSKND